MKYDCEVIRDLLPLYADEACSEKSRAMVEEHLRECEACSGMMDRLRETEIETALRSERESVIQYGVRQFRRRTAVVGSSVSGVLLIPILICLAANLIAGPSLTWISVVMAALCVPASLILVPLTVREDKAFWTFCAFCASLLLLLGTACLYVRGDWFWIASSGVLLGLSLIFLPFLIRARPLKALIGGGNRLMIVLGVDAALFFNVLNAVNTRGRITLGSILFTVGVIGGIVTVALAVYMNRKQRPHEGPDPAAEESGAPADGRDEEE